MHLKQISILLIIAGLVMGAWGGYDLYKIQSQRDSYLSTVRSSPGEIFGSAIDRINKSYVGNRVADMSEKPTKIAIFGGVIFIIGLIMSGFAKKGQQADRIVERDEHTEKIEEKIEVKTTKEIEEEKEAVAKREAELDKERREKADKDFFKY